jgi:hypothetical protein
VSYRLCIGSRNRKSGEGPTKGCRTTIIIIIIIIIMFLEEWTVLGCCGSWTSGFQRVNSPSGVFIQLSANSDAKVRHLDKVQFLVLSAVQSPNSQKCEKNVVALNVMFRVISNLINDY